MKLRDYQQSAIDSIYRYFETNSGNPIVVAATGAGKSIMIGSFIQGVLTRWPNQRILMLTHVKELIAQNYEKLKTLWPEAPAGIYSASVGRRDTRQPIIYAGIQSIHKKAFQLGWFDLALIDECHLLAPSGEGMYNTLLADLRRMNPKIKVIGFSATPFRMKSGHLISEGSLFTDICYEIKIKTLIDQGHLCPVRPKRMETDFQMDNIRIHGGEYSLKDMQAKMDREELTVQAVNEIVECGRDRRSWLVFCSGVEHAFHVRDELRKRGVTAETVTGKTSKMERDRIIIEYKRGNITALTNADVLTTGFDAPATDLLAVLRGTKSPGLWVQIVGRGMRISPDTGKQDCLVLDFGRNSETHGPIDEITMRPKMKTVEPREAPMKTCPECGAYALAVARVCDACGHEFLFSESQRFNATADERELLSFAGLPKPYEVTRLQFRRHQKPGSPDSLCVVYFAGLREVAREWICIEHQGRPRLKAVSWWRQWVNANTPRTVTQALEIVGTTTDLVRPVMISVKESGKYPEVVGYEFGVVA